MVSKKFEFGWKKGKEIFEIYDGLKVDINYGLDEESTKELVHQTTKWIGGWKYEDIPDISKYQGICTYPQLAKSQ